MSFPSGQAPEAHHKKRTGRRKNLSDMDDLPKPGWLERLSALLLREPGDREQLIALLDSAYERNLFDSDALSRIEGVMQVSEMQARDIMIPRSKREVIEIGVPPEKFIP